jgi:peptide/nickel transport system substrate-binding protein/glutathione transport system substrate-binding protein
MTTETKSGFTLDRRDVLKGVAALGGAMVLPGSLYAQGAPRRGGTLRVTIPFNPAAIDPMTGRNLPDFDTLYQIFDALIDFEPKTLELKPGLAKSWRFTDPKTLVLDLVEGVKFHDGTPFNPEAVVINTERYKNDPRSNVKSDLATVDKVDVTGPNQVTYRLNRPNAGLPVMLTNRIGLMVSPKLIQERGPNLDRLAVGTGPFKFVEWQDNTSITLVKNENYWKQGLPYLDGIVLRIVNELNTGARTVIAGEADLALNLQPPQKAIADRAGGGIVAEANPSLVFYGAFLNYAKPPLDNVKVRQAMNCAINREEINTVIALGYGEPSSVILPKSHWACDPATADFYKHDLNKAKQLLTEAGYPNGLEIETWGWADQVAMQRQELIISQLARAGIRIKLTPAQPQQTMQSFMMEKRGSMLISPGGGFPDPSLAYEQLFGGTALRNAGKIELPGFRELLDATMEAQDLATRKAAFVKLQRFVTENALQLVQFVASGVTIRGPKVQNFKENILTTPKLADVWLSA